MTATLSDRAALLRSILEYPEEDFPRLAFADWLAENGEEERAAMIRKMVEDGNERYGGPCNGHYMRFYGIQFGFPCHLDIVIASRGFVSEIRLPCADFLRHAEELFSQHPITRVVLTDKRPHYDPRRNAYSWCSTLPHSGRESYYLPEKFNHLAWGFYDNEPCALDALSAACVAYGRELAGLRPLTQENV